MWQVLGQDRAIRLLESSLKGRGPAHAYLLVGPAHVGKMTLALNLAQALNCLSPDPPCGQCHPCQRIATGKHSDVQVVHLEVKDGRQRQEIGIDRIKELCHAAQLPPYEGKFKVFIIDGAERLSGEAANSLLKTLEEPPPQVVFLLLTSHEKGVLSTILSRCQRLELPPLPLPQAEAILKDALGIPPAHAHLLAHLSQGCLGWAILANRDKQLLAQRQERLSRFAASLKASYEDRFSLAEELARLFERDRESVLETLEMWRGWWRDILLLKARCLQAVVNKDREVELEVYSRAFTWAVIKGAIDRLNQTAEALRQNANPRLALETLMLELPRLERVAVK